MLKAVCLILFLGQPIYNGYCKLKNAHKNLVMEVKSNLLSSFRSIAEQISWSSNTLIYILAYNENVFRPVWISLVVAKEFYHTKLEIPEMFHRFRKILHQYVFLLVNIYVVGMLELDRLQK
jgi:hypothetical protein